jgi:hypothetical protein
MTGQVSGQFCLRENDIAWQRYAVKMYFFLLDLFNKCASIALSELVMK